jgi:tripartite-type tricarboxylate transporter receptor subunit TctC
MELFRGISMPQGTPDAIVKKLADAFEKGAENADFKKIAKQKGFNISFMGNEAFEAYLKVQNENIAEGMKLGGLVK